MLGGLLVGQVLRSFTPPWIYLYMDRLNSWVSQFGFATPPGGAAPSTEAVTS